MGINTSENWFIMPICLYHNAKKCGNFTLTKPMTVVEIEPLDRKEYGKIPVDQMAAHDPNYQTILMGVDENGVPHYETILQGDITGDARKD